MGRSNNNFDKFVIALWCFGSNAQALMLSKSIESQFSINDGFVTEAYAAHNSTTHVPSSQPTVQNNIPTTEYNSLKDLYYYLNGDYWTWSNSTTYTPLNLTWFYLNKTGIQPPKLPLLANISSYANEFNRTSYSHWNFSGIEMHNPCSEGWQGLQCVCYAGSKLVRSFCNIIAIDLRMFNLTGSIPNSVGNFTGLTFLDLGRNNIRGTIPHQIGRLATLQALFLPGNQIRGSIPSQITQLTHLLVLELLDNRLTGTVPAQIVALTRLRSLALSWNKLSGPIPQHMNEMRNLTELWLYNNSMTGTIPPELFHLTELENIFLSINDFSGSIPGSIGNATRLKNLNFNFNKLVGSIPEGVCRLAHLNVLELADNRLTGGIPQCIGNLSTLNLLVLSGNLLTGTMPQQLNEMPLLQAVYLNENYFSGQMPTFAAAGRIINVMFLGINMFTGTVSTECTVGNTELLEFLAQQNQFSGPLPSFAGASKLTYMALYANQFTGQVTPLLGNLTLINYFDLGANYLTGSLPSSLGRIKRITYLYTNQNYLTGSIPSDFSNLDKLAELWLYRNMLSGTLPSTVGSMVSLMQFYLQENRFTGTLPASLQTLAHLELFFVFGNRLTGQLTGFLNPAVQRNVSNIDVSNNQFTGPIPTNIFEIPALLSFAASTNCLRGSIPDSICDATSLTALALDGLSTADACQDRIFEHSRGFSNAYTLRNYIQGDIPRCLFRMPSIQSLHLSGNGIVGSLDDTIVLAHSLVDLSLSHNVLTGHIPLQFQTRAWGTLDLSFNKISGVLSEGYLQPEDSSSLSLQVNRLSGNIPNSLRTAANIDILDGNMFECSVDRKELPRFDSKTPTYQCGSDAFNRSVYLWFAAFGVCAIVVILLVLSFRRKVFRFMRERPYYLWMQSCADDIRLWLQVFSEEVSLTANQTVDVYNFGQLISSLRRICVMLTLFMVVVLLPIYLLLTSYLNTYQYEYAWTASSAYLSGVVPAICLLVAFSALIAFVIYIFDRYVFSTTNKFIDALTRDTIDEADRDALCGAQNVGQWACIAVVAVVNLSVILPVDMVYVYIVLNEEISVVACAQFSLAIFKIVWNDIAVRKMLLYARSLYFRADPVDEKKELHLALEKRRETRDILFLVRMVLINNIAVPCLAIAFVSSNCFYNVIEAPPPVDSSYFYEQCWEDYVSPTRGYECLQYGESYQSITYDPPFIYSYQCSSVFATTYATIYVYMFILVGFALPAFKILLVLLRDHFQPQSTSYKTINSLLPVNLRPLPADVPSPPPRYFDKPSFIVRINSNVAILLTFGAMCPPLAVVICISIFSYTYYEQLAVGRLLTQMKSSKGMSAFKSLVDGELRDLSESFEHSIWIVVPFASMFYAYFVFDTLGDAVGGPRAAWVPIVMLCIPVAVFVMIRGKGCYTARLMTRDLGNQLTSRLATLSHRVSMISRPTTTSVRDSSMAAGSPSESPLHRGPPSMSSLGGVHSMWRRDSTPFVFNPEGGIKDVNVISDGGAISSGSSVMHETEMTVFNKTTKKEKEDSAPSHI